MLNEEDFNIGSLIGCAKKGECEEEVNTLFGESFIALFFLRELLNVSVSNQPGKYYRKVIEYELAKLNNADISIQQQLLTVLDEELPEALCETIDEVVDVRLLDLTLIQDVKDFIAAHKDKLELYKEVRTYYADDFVKALTKFITKYETPKHLTFSL
jgi:hypothetical protein